MDEFWDADVAIIAMEGKVIHLLYEKGETRRQCFWCCGKAHSADKRTVRNENGDNLRFCTLCPEYVFTSWSSHAEDQVHRDRLKRSKIAKDYLKRSRQTYKLLARLRSLGGNQIECRLKLLSYLFQEPGASTYGQLQTIVNRHERELQLTLLEMALWKSACILHPPAMLTSVTAVLFWMQSGWKQNKPAMRRHELITVVMQHVIPLFGLTSGLTSQVDLALFRRYYNNDT